MVIGTLNICQKIQKNLTLTLTLTSMERDTARRIDRMAHFGLKR